MREKLKKIASSAPKLELTVNHVFSFILL